MAEIDAEIRRKSKVEKGNRVLGRLTVEYVPTDSLRPNPYNPNRQDEHDFELLCKSIAADGFTQPVIVTYGSVIVDGEHRWRAAQALNMAEVPVVRVKMSEEQMRIATLRHNRARGSEDLALSADLIRDLVDGGAAEFLKDQLMLDDVELAKFMQAEEPELRAGDFAGSDDPSGELRRREAAGRVESAAEERDMAGNDEGTVKLYFSYTPEQAARVRAVLGADLADGLYRLCVGAERA